MEERERACDEKVLEQSAQPEVYAESILKVCAFCLEPSAPCVAGVSGSDLKERVLRIMTHRGGMSLSFGRRVVLCSAASLAIGLPLGFGILDAMQAPTQLVHATTASAPAFDVVSIKPNHDPAPRRLIGISPTGFTAKRASLRDIIGMAYGVKGDDQVIGGPSWMNSEYYDVDAKASEVGHRGRKQSSHRGKKETTLADDSRDAGGPVQLKTSIETT